MFLADAATAPAFGGDVGLVATFLQFGVVGILLICLLTNKFIVPKWTLDRADEEHQKEMDALRADNKELKESNAALRTLTEQQIIPALVRSNQLSADYAADLAAERRRRHGEDD